MKQTLAEQLDSYFRQVQEILLSRQDWITGLLPASTAINEHGDYTDAWVRDNVYSILAAWGVGLAYRRAGIKNGRAYLLEQSVVKLMRGLLTAMMRQAEKVEKFKLTQNPMDALHAKYDTKTGQAVVGDHEWGHLQLDATSLFLLMLAQMTASGLRIVFTLNEVNFVQNLLHYISRTYRTPDYGIWERGNKINHGIAELNASSIGMAKAAMEALSNLNLFGVDGGQSSVVHVISDDIARTRITLESLLPRESVSKEVDAAVLSIIGFPAFAVDDQRLSAVTETLICEKLAGRYGCKRFLRDGHQTVLEDNQRLHYEPHELKQFADIECEWPLFFTYLLLNKLFAGDVNAAQRYRELLNDLLVEKNGQRLLPELYLVPAELIAAEKEQPHSQQRVPNENIPLVWAQSLFILGSLIQDGLLKAEEIDPLRRARKRQKRATSIVQLILIAEDGQVQRQLAERSIPAQAITDIAPVQIRDAKELSDAFAQVGRNDRIGLTGRPRRQLRTLATSKIYELAGEFFIFLPQCLNQRGFYIAMDNRLLIQRLRVELTYVYENWDHSGHPLISIPVKHNMLDGQNGDILFEFLAEVQQGACGDIPVRVVTLPECFEESGHEKINYLHDFQFSKAASNRFARPFTAVLPVNGNDSKPLAPQLSAEWETLSDSQLMERLTSDGNLYSQLEVLTLLKTRHGLEHKTNLLSASQEAATVRDLLDEVYARAGDLHLWFVVRRCAGLIGKYDIYLEQAANEILIRQHSLTLGRAYSGKATLKRPADSSEILDKIRTYNTDPSEQIIIQELILYLGMLMKSDPELFTDMHTVRVGHLLQLIIVRQEKASGCESLDQAFNLIMSTPPYQLSEKVRDTLADYHNTRVQLQHAESLHFHGDSENLHATNDIALGVSEPEDIEDWHGWREQQGSIGRDNKVFFDNVWTILHHCHGLSIGDKLNSKNRLDSNTVLSQMTPEEQSFTLYVSHLLNKIQAPVYRQLTVEALNAVAAIFRENESLIIDDTLVVDILIGHAVRLNWLQQSQRGVQDYEHCLSQAWEDYYQLPPQRMAWAVKDALKHLLQNE